MSSSSSTSLPPLPTDPQALRKLNAAQWKAVLEAPPQVAIQWMTAAARQGHAGSQAVLGQWLLEGRGTARNPGDAFAWFLKAAQQGDDTGMNMTGRCYENGWGVEPDLQAAIRWYRHAAIKGLDAGLYNLANQYASGQGIPRDDAQALALYTQAAQMGHAKSMTKSGRFHEDGLSVPRDLEKAMDCYRRGAEGGDFRGQYNYARMLAERGSVEASLDWLRRVPLTATPDFLEEAARLLSDSPDARFRAVAQEMLARAGQLRAAPTSGDGSPSGAQ